jgi:hypothetical protein
MFKELLSRVGRTLDGHSLPYMIIDGQGVRFASAEDVIIHKIFAGRPRDLEDVRAIVIKNPGIDRTYIGNWLEQFDASRDETDGKGFVETFQKVVEGVT